MSSTRPVLYGYWRSSCSWRVRIALHLKGIPFEQRPVNLLQGEHRTPEMADKLPFQLVPSLVFPEGLVLSESMAIIEFLDEKYPGNTHLLPGTPEDRARIRSLALLIVADTQPLQNTGVLAHLSADPGKQQEWAHHWITKSFTRLEQELTKCSGKFSYGDQVSLLDCCIPPQVHNAKRFGVDMTRFPTIVRIERQLAELPAFQAADAFHQPDTPADQKKA